jgi:hypothetical protein
VIEYEITNAVLNSNSTVVTGADLGFCCLADGQHCDIPTPPSFSDFWTLDVLSQYHLHRIFFTLNSILGYSKCLSDSSKNEMESKS